jgi:hypothetical protein
MVEVNNSCLTVEGAALNFGKTLGSAINVELKPQCLALPHRLTQPREGDFQLLRSL